MTPPKPSRRRLTQAEWEAELARAKAVQAADVVARIERRPGDPEIGQPPSRPSPYVARTGRRRSWWQRGWKR